MKAAPRRETVILDVQISKGKPVFIDPISKQHLSAQTPFLKLQRNNSERHSLRPIQAPLKVKTQAGPKATGTDTDKPKDNRPILERLFARKRKPQLFHKLASPVGPININCPLPASPKVACKPRRSSPFSINRVLKPPKPQRRAAAPKAAAPSAAVAVAAAPPVATAVPWIGPAPITKAEQRALYHPQVQMALLMKVMNYQG